MKNSIHLITLILTLYSCAVIKNKESNQNLHPRKEAKYPEIYLKVLDNKKELSPERIEIILTLIKKTNIASKITYMSETDYINHNTGIPLLTIELEQPQGNPFYKLWLELSLKSATLIPFYGQLEKQANIKLERKYITLAETIEKEEVHILLSPLAIPFTIQHIIKGERIDELMPQKMKLLEQGLFRIAHEK